MGIIPVVNASAETPVNQAGPAGWLGRGLVVVVLVAVLVRVAVLLLLRAAGVDQEFADDFFYYSIMIDRPLMLITGAGSDAMGMGQVYAPLLPIELLIPGWPLIKAFGLSFGHRLAMVCYDVAAVGVAFSVAFVGGGRPTGWRDWAVATALACLPVSILSAAVWGQEDTIAAFWAALALLACWRGRPVLASVIGGAGLFTYKLFSLVLVMGIWLATTGKRKAIAVAGAACVAAFVVFLGLRWLNSGLFWPGYAYEQIDNSASPWAAWQLLAGGLTFDGIRLGVMGTTLCAMGLWAILALRCRPTLPAAVVGMHAAFFSVFIGIHPEHHQWFAPFLIYLAWESYKRHRQWLLPTLCWAYGTLAYGYKIAYGLRGGESVASGGKQALRDWFQSHMGFDIFWIQIALLLATLACGLVLCVLCLRYRDGATPETAEAVSAQATNDGVAAV